MLTRDANLLTRVVLGGNNKIMTKDLEETIEDIFETYEFKRLLLKVLWKLARKHPDIKKRLEESQIPRSLPRLPPEKDYFVPIRQTRSKKQIH